MTSIVLPRFGVGCSPMGGSLRANLSDEDVRAIVETADRLGISYFDTAPHYGQGYSEKRLGKAMKSVRHSERIISTKVGVSLVPGVPGEYRGGIDFKSPEPYESVFDFTAEGVRRSLDQSLERLPHVDIAYIHDPDEGVTLGNPGADPYSKSHIREVFNSVYPELVDLKRAGRVRAIGVGINQWQMLREFAMEGDFDFFLLARQLTLLEHAGAALELLPLCRARGVKIVAAGVFHNGILATGSLGGSSGIPFFDTGPASAEVVNRTQRIEKVCNTYDVPLQAAALQFPLRFPEVCTVVAGVRSARELEEDYAWIHRSIPDEFWEELIMQEIISC